MNSKKAMIFSNISWAVMGKVVDIVRALLIGILIARYLKPYNYGVLNYVLGYVGMFLLFVEFGMSGILGREFSKIKSDKNVLLGSAIVFRLLMVILVIPVIVFTVLYFEKDLMVRVFIIINSLNLIFYSISETVRSFFRSQLKNEYIIKSEIFKTVFVAGIKLLLLFFKAPLIYFIVASSLDSLILLFPFYYYFNKKYWNITLFKFDFNACKVLVVSSMPLFFEGVAAVLYQRIDVVMAGKLIGSEAVGYYSVALKFVAFGLFLPLVIAQTLSPLLVQKLEENNNDIKSKRYLEYRQKVADIIIVAGFVISLFLFLTAKPVIVFLYGQEYVESVSILKILAWKGLFSGLGYAGSVIIVAEGRQKYVYIRNIIGGILNLGLNFLLIPYFDIAGVALATIISFCMATYLSNWLIPLYRIDFKIQTKSMVGGVFRSFRYLKEML